MSIDIKEAMAETAWVEELASLIAPAMHGTVMIAAVHQGMFPSDSPTMVREHLWDGTVSRSASLAYDILTWLRSHPLPSELTP